MTLKKSSSARAYVFFTPYRPWLLQKDLAFFDLAQESGFAVNKLFEKVMDKVMFEEDPGVSHKSHLTTTTVHFYLLILYRMSCSGEQCMDTNLAGPLWHRTKTVHNALQNNSINNAKIEIAIVIVE